MEEREEDTREIKLGFYTEEVALWVIFLAVE